MSESCESYVDTPVAEKEIELRLPSCCLSAPTFVNPE